MAGLIITNGDAAADLLSAAGKSARFLPWRDVLHEGPIVAGPLSVCSTVRARYLADRFRIPAGEIADEFAARDAVLAAHAAYDRIELWFEHDLYDQLQLVQVLASLAEDGRTEGVVLVQADDFLGRQRPDTILGFEARARPLESDDLDRASGVWSALASPAPKPVFLLAAEPVGGFPFLAPALRRFLEELPAPGSGLGRTEATALEGLAHGIADPVELFRSAIGEEEAAFMGDLSFFRLLEDLAFCPVPLIEGLPRPRSAIEAPDFAAAVLRLTPAGEAVHDGEEDCLALNPIDRWCAGTRLLPGNDWRYDRDKKDLVLPGVSGA